MELFRLFGRIAIDNTEANNAIDETSRRAEASAEETQGAFEKIGNAARTVAIGIGTAVCPGSSTARKRGNGFCDYGTVFPFD